MTRHSSTVSQVLESLARDARFWDPTLIDKSAADGELTIALLTALLGTPQAPRSSVIDALFSLLPESDIPALVERAVSALGPSLSVEPAARGRPLRDVAPDQAAIDVIEQACHQAPVDCHPHLAAIFAAGRETPRLSLAFREAPPSAVRFLLDQLPSLAGEERRRAIFALLETRHPAVVSELLAASMASAGDLEHVGIEQETGGLRSLYVEEPRHLVFPLEYVDALPKYVTHLGEQTRHPTWTVAPAAYPYSLGGRSEALCEICGGRLQRLLRFGSVPEGIGVMSVRSLDLVTCLSCLGWEAPVLTYQHDTEGHPRSIRPAGVELHAPKFPIDEALRETPVGLVVLRPRWRWQEWSQPANLNRVGGHPSWVQNAEYPRCPGCDARMRFLMQLDSDLPLESGEGWLWGSGGVCYVFWCDPCNISGTMWQCT